MTASEMSRTEWLEMRRKTLGASDAPIALGLSPYRTPRDLALDKKGKLPDSEQSKYAERGQILEKYVAMAYSQITGIEDLAEYGTVVHPDHEWMSATPDRGIDQIGLLEIKTVNKWAADDYGDSNTEDIPDTAFIQAQHQLAVTGREWCDVCALIADEGVFDILVGMAKDGVADDFIVSRVKDMDVKMYRILRNDEFIEKMIVAEKEFWDLYVVGDDLPVDIATMEPKSGVRVATAEEKTLLAQLKEQWFVCAAADDAYDELAHKVKLLIDDAEGIQGEYKITYRKPKDSIRTSWKDVAAEFKNVEGYEDAVVKHSKETVTARRFLVPAKKWGAERMK